TREPPAQPTAQPSPQAAAPVPASADSPTVLPAMPSLDDLFAGGTDEPPREPSLTEPASASTTPVLPDLDDLFAEGVETVILELLAVEGENAIPIGSPARLTLTLNDDAGDNQTPPPPPAVVAREDVFSLNKGVLDAPLDVLANDRINRGPARIVSVTQPLGGSVRIDADQAGLLYTAECGFAGSAGFSYTVEADSEQATAEVSLNLEVGPPAEGLPGDVDTRFGCAGFLRESAGVRQGESLLLDDGRLLLSQTVLVGEPARQRIELAMFDGFGSPDLSFGSAGRVLLPESLQGFSLAFASRLQQQGAFLLLASPSNIAAGSSMTQSLALLRVCSGLRVPASAAPWLAAVASRALRPWCWMNLGASCWVAMGAAPPWWEGAFSFAG
ncbi:MAG: Ig-like domain-containing protein, partial [Oceanococcaceae bacterium]